MHTWQAVGTDREHAHRKWVLGIPAVVHVCLPTCDLTGIHPKKMKIGESSWGTVLHTCQDIEHTMPAE